MIWILLTILSATGIFVFFKLFDKFKVPTLNAIVINYFVAGVLGFFLTENVTGVVDLFSESWFYIAVIIGVLFIVMFFVIGKSSAVSGMSLTTLASKMSVVIPILFSIVYYGEALTSVKIVGIIMALIGLVLAVLKKQEGGKVGQQVILPIVLFLGMGSVDSLVKFAQQEYVTDDISSVFTSLLFSISFIVGLIIMLFKPKSFKDFANPKCLLLGVGLGIVNYGSIYFLIRALNSSVMDSSVIFGINNISIVALSALIGFVFFKERLSKLNWIGLFVCMVAIAVLYITK